MTIPFEETVTSSKYKHVMKAQLQTPGGQIWN
jgi:hypothetical protein